MPIAPSDLDLTQAVDASTHAYLGEAAYEAVKGSLVLHETKRTILEILLPALPYIVAQTGREAFREGVEEGMLGLPIDGPTPFSPEFKTPYDDVIITESILGGVSA